MLFHSRNYIIVSINCSPFILLVSFFFFFKQKTAYEMRISDWSSDVCSSDLSLYIGNVMLLVLNLPLVGLWVRLLSIPQPLLYGGILLFSSLGAYSLNGSAFDLIVLWVIGLIGYLMRRFDFPVAPCVIGLILGPLAEEQMRRALSISQGDVSVFFTHPLSATRPAHAARSAQSRVRQEYCHTL